MELLGYPLILFMGFTLGLLGGGGSILTVPILTYVFAVPPVQATAYSLFIVGLSSSIGAFTKAREGYVNLKVAALFAVPGFLGVFVSRAAVIPNIPDVIAQMGSIQLTKDILIMMVFALMMILASVSMIRGRKEESGKAAHMASAPMILLLGFVIGLITGFVGAGGGFIIIPALTILAGLPMRTTVGTSLLIISVNSLFGFVGDVVSQPKLDWSLLFLLSGISIVGILIGSRMSKQVPEKKLKKIFGYFVLIMGIAILYKQIS